MKKKNGWKILRSKLQMTNQSLNDNYKREEFGIQKFEVGVSRASIESANVLVQSSFVWAESTNLLT
jgi:hypothetical protein